MGQRINSAFRPAWWLPGAHGQTLWPTFFRPRPVLELSTERMELADGDFLDLAWSGAAQAPIVILLHGLEGSLQSHYALSTMKVLIDHSYRACFMHLRGCSGEPNRLDRSYHSGASEDLEAVIQHIAQTQGRQPQAVIGFSLGGNLLLKYLGEQGAATRLQAAVAVSVPFRLMDAAQRLEQGFSRFYREHLLQRLRRSYLNKFRQRPPPLAINVNALRSFYAFDEQITAPLNGFRGAADYYARCSCRAYLKQIVTPTLILHAQDDPFMFRASIPTEAELGPGVTLELARGGGHVGFVGGALPGKARYWTDQRLPVFLKQHIACLGNNC
jgi:predicted alpha/beta-fold hydrolase